MILMFLAFVFIFPLEELPVQGTMVATVFTLAVTSLLLIKRGRYTFSANMVTLAFAVLATTGLLRQIWSGPNFGYTSYIYFFGMIIVMSALFCRPAIIYIVSFSFISADIFFHNGI